MGGDTEYVVGIDDLAIEQGQIASLAPGFVSLGVLFLIGVAVSVFARSVFWWWLGFLRRVGMIAAERLKSDPERWVPKVPQPRMLHAEIWALRATGLFLAVAAVFGTVLMFMW